MSLLTGGFHMNIILLSHFASLAQAIAQAFQKVNLQTTWKRILDCSKLLIKYQPGGANWPLGLYKLHGHEYHEIYSYGRDMAGPTLHRTGLTLVK